MNDESYINSPIVIEKELIDFFNKKTKIVIFDIGSCDGLDSIKYSNIFPNSKIYAFEPLDNNIDLIKKNIKKYKKTNIVPIQIALSDKNGEVDFYISSGKKSDNSISEWNKSSSLLEPEKHIEIFPWVKFNERIKVKTQTVEDFCNYNNIDSIDFIHMDVQGAELLVLNGAKSKINFIKMIWLEVENIDLYKNQPLKKDVENFMMSNGFSLIKDTVNNIAGDQLWVNYNFFMRKKITHNIWKLYSNFFS